MQLYPDRQSFTKVSGCIYEHFYLDFFMNIYLFAMFLDVLMYPFT